MIAVNSGLTGLLRGFQRGSKEVLTIHNAFQPFKKDNKYGNKRLLTSVLQSYDGFSLAWPIKIRRRKCPWSRATLAGNFYGTGPDLEIPTQSIRKLFEDVKSDQTLYFVATSMCSGTSPVRPSCGQRKVTVVDGLFFLRFNIFVFKVLIVACKYLRQSKHINKSATRQKQDQTRAVRIKFGDLSR